MHHVDITLTTVLLVPWMAHAYQLPRCAMIHEYASVRLLAAWLGAAKWIMQLLQSCPADTFTGS